VANEKISELPPGQPAQSGDLIPIARTAQSTNYAIGVSDIANFIGTRGGIALAPGGNTAGATAVISSGTLSLIGGNNITLSQAGQSITLQGGGGFNASVGGTNTAGTPAIVSSGTLFLAGGNNVTLSQSANSVTISAGSVAPSPLPVSGGTTSGAFTGLTFGNANNVSAGLSNGTVTFTVAQTVQTQASGAIARTGFTSGSTTGTALQGTLNTSGLSLGVPAYLTTQSVQTQGLNNVSIFGNVSGAPALVSTGTLYLAGGNNVTLSQNGNSVTVSAGLMGQSTQTQASGAIAGTGFSSASTAGTALVGTLNTVGLSVGVPNFLTTQSVQTQASGRIAGTGFTSGPTVGTVLQGTLNTAGLSLGVPAYITTQSVQTQNLVEVSLGGNTVGTLALVSSGTFFLAGGNNITLSQNGQSVTISANTAAQATVSISAGTTSGAFNGLTFANSNNVSWGLNNGTLTATFGLTAGQSVQTQASGAIAGTGFSSATTAGTAVVGTLNTAGLSLGVPAFLTTQSAQTGLAGIGFTTGPNVGTALVGTLDTNGLSLGVPAYITTQSIQTQGLNSVSIGGQVSGTPALITAGTLVLAGGNNVTLSQNSNTITISGAANLSVSAGTTSNTFGGLTFANSNNITFGLNNGTITASIAFGGQSVQTQASGNIAATGFVTTSTAGSVILGTNNTAGFTLAVPPYITTQSNQTQGGYAAGNTIYASSTTFDPRSQSTYGSGIITLGFTNGSNVIYASQSAQTEGLYVTGANTVGATSSTFDARSLSISGAGNISVGFTNGALVISGTGGGGGGVTSGAAYIAGNTTGTTSSTYALSSLNVSFAGGLVSGGWQGGALVVSAPATTALSQSLFATGNTVLTSFGTGSIGSLLLSGAGGASVGISNGTVVISAQPAAPLSRLIWPVGQQLTAIAPPTNAAISVQYVAPQQGVTASRVDALVSWLQGSGANASTAGVVISAYAAVFTLNGSTLSSLSTGSVAATYTYGSNNSGNTQLLAGAIRPVSVPMNMYMTPGEYFVAFNFSTNSTGNTSYGQTLSMMGGNNLQTGAGANYAEFTAATASTTNLFGGMGIYSATGLGIPVSMALSRIVQTGASLAQANIALIFRDY
jgi:hypothetical protein